MSDLFLSYAREDRRQAEGLARAFEARGWSVWWDRSIPTGSSFDEMIEKAIESAACVVVLWSERSVTSRWVRTEAEEGAKRNVLVPIRIADVEIPLAFRNFQTADLSGWKGGAEDPAIEALAADIGRLLQQPPAPRKETRPGGEVPGDGGAKRHHWRENLFFSTAAVVVAFGLWGLLDLGDLPFAGLRAGPRGEVIRITPDSPAERAGFKVGDVIKSDNGISADDWYAQFRAGLPEIGSTHTWVVERAGESLTLQITYGQLPRGQRAVVWIRATVGIAILALCVWVYSEGPGAATWILALHGLCFSVSFLVVRGQSSPDVVTFVGYLVVILFLTSLALLVHFLLLFPQRSPLLDKAVSLKLVYFPVVVVALVNAVGVWADPDLQVVTLLARVFYFVVAFALMARTFLQATPAERSAHGLHLMLAGLILGLTPPAALLLIGTIAPTTWLPGADLYQLAIGLIPITFAIAILRGKEAAPAA